MSAEGMLAFYVMFVLVITHWKPKITAELVTQSCNLVIQKTIIRLRGRRAMRLSGNVLRLKRRVNINPNYAETLHGCKPEINSFYA